ncbi:MAG: glutathione S-transferase C-terminal domain-containing protein [Pseudomonadota bacterium]
MGLMIEGIYQVEEPAPDSADDGRFRRAKATVRNWITADGSPGPTGEGGFPAEAGRYHLYVAWNCPWAHRALLTQALLGLEDAIGLSIARPRRTDQGWVFDGDGAFADPLYGAEALHQAYTRTAPDYTGRVTVPLLVDRESGRAVSNESADIVQMLAAFGQGPELRPAALADAIEGWNARIYADVNNGVYRAGFARTQAAYDEAVQQVFAALDEIDAQLGRTRYLTGEQFTEADLRLFPTLARFDVAYHYAFKCNIRRLADYAHLWPYAREIYAMPGVAETVNFEIYKQGYFSPSELRNPLGIVPAGPVVDWSEPHGRG